MQSSVVFFHEELAAWTGGQWTDTPRGALRGLAHDTRTLQPGQVYLALCGEQFDGHAFVDQAFEKGAAAAVIERSGAAGSAPGPRLLVDDTRRALQDMARGYRGRVGAEWLAVTGSVGKTTVKEMTADLLQALGPVARSRGNWNNDIGVPMSLLQVPPDSRFAVMELGMNHPGELAPLCELARPSWGIMTRVGPVHMEFFPSEEAIAEEKAELLRALPAAGTAVLAADEPWFELFLRAAPCRVVTVTLGGGEADYRGEARPGVPGGLRVTEREGAFFDYELPWPGEAARRNALRAIAVAREHEISFAELAPRLRAFQLPAMRWNRLERAGLVWINDAYNANPISMQAALDAFADEPCDGAKWLVLAGMHELGAQERLAHEAIGRAAAAGPWAGLLAVGDKARAIADGAEEAAMPSDRICRLPDPEAAAEWLRARAQPGDAVLLKGSRAEKLEKILQDFEQRT